MEYGILVRRWPEPVQEQSSVCKPSMCGILVKSGSELVQEQLSVINP